MIGAPIEEIAPLQTLLGHRFSRPDLLWEALTHSGAAAEGDYQRLEFLGDRVLGLIIAGHLLETHGDADAGELALRYNALVRAEACAEVATAAGLGAFVRLGKGEALSGGAAKPGILADVCEAVIAALYLDGGLDAATGFVLRLWAPLLEEQTAAVKDPKTALQEWAQRGGLGQPVYSLVSRTGPDHEPLFTASVDVPGSRIAASAATGRGPSKRAAEQAAAANAMEAGDGT